MSKQTNSKPEPRTVTSGSSGKSGTTTRVNQPVAAPHGGGRKY